MLTEVLQTIMKIVNTVLYFEQSCTSQSRLNRVHNPIVNYRALAAADQPVVKRIEKAPDNHPCLIVSITIAMSIDGVLCFSFMVVKEMN